MPLKKTKKAKGRLDKFYYAAKQENYRSRASFKLVAINQRFNLLRDSRVIVDLCAAPGSWCQVAVKHAPRGAMIIGVDLDPIAPIAGVISFEGDITTEKTRSELLRIMRGAVCIFCGEREGGLVAACVGGAMRCVLPGAGVRRARGIAEDGSYAASLRVCNR